MSDDDEANAQAVPDNLRTCKAPTFELDGIRLDKCISKVVGMPSCESKREGYPDVCEVTFGKRVDRPSPKVVLREQKDFNPFAMLRKINDLVSTLQDNHKVKERSRYTVADWAAYDANMELLDWYDESEPTRADINPRGPKHNQFDALMQLKTAEEFSEYLASDAEPGPMIDLKKLIREKKKWEKAKPISTGPRDDYPCKRCPCRIMPKLFEDFMTENNLPEIPEKKQPPRIPKLARSYMGLKNFREQYVTQPYNLICLEQKGLADLKGDLVHQEEDIESLIFLLQQDYEDARETEDEDAIASSEDE